MRWLMLIATLGLGSGTSQAAGPAKVSSVDKTVERGLAFLAKDAVAWKEKYKCMSCHHGGLVVWAMRESKAQGYAVDEPLLADLARQIAESGNGKTGVERPKDLPKALNTKAVNFAMALASDPHPDEKAKKGLALMLATVREDQTDDGSWQAWPMARPPIFDRSHESVTAMSTLALLPAAATGDKPSIVARDRAVRWLGEHKTDGDAQSVAYRLMVWRQLDKPAAEWQPLVEQIRQRQNTDGGWSQTKELASDPWATGQALYALALAGVASNDPAISRAHAFMAKSQREDGSWAMTSRPNPPNNKGANSLVPITGGGAAWGVIGLVRSR